MASRAARCALLSLLGSTATFAQTAAVAPPPGADAPQAVTIPAAPRLSDVDHAEDMERETFDGAVRRALAQNPSVAIAVEEIRRVDALLAEVRSSSLPTVAANLTYTRLDANRLEAQPPPAPPVVAAAINQLSGSATLAVPLVAAKSWVQWRQANDNLAVSRLSADDQRRQIAVAAGRAYLTIVAQKDTIGATRRARDTARAHYDYAHARYVAGIGNRLDEVRAAEEVATDESQLQSAIANLAKAREALGVLLAVEGPVDTTEEPDLGGAVPLGDALADSGKLRADVRAASRRLDAAHHVAKDSYADYLPYLTGTFQGFIQDPPTLTLPLYGWQAQIILGLPLYDGGLRDGQRRERRALESEARTNLAATLRQARSDVRAAFETLRRSDESLYAARDAARLTHEALGLAQLSYRAGASTNLEVIDAERAARDADTAVAVAGDAARQARLDLLAASGRFP